MYVYNSNLSKWGRWTVIVSPDQSRFVSKHHKVSCVTIFEAATGSSHAVEPVPAAAVDAGNTAPVRVDSLQYTVSFASHLYLKYEMIIHIHSPNRPNPNLVLTAMKQHWCSNGFGFLQHPPFVLDPPRAWTKIGDFGVGMRGRSMDEGTLSLWLCLTQWPQLLLYVIPWQTNFQDFSGTLAIPSHP